MMQHLQHHSNHTAKMLMTYPAGPAAAMLVAAVLPSVLIAAAGATINNVDTDAGLDFAGRAAATPQLQPLLLPRPHGALSRTAT